MPNVIDECNNNFYDDTSSRSISLFKLNLDNTHVTNMPSNFIALKSLEVLHLSSHTFKDSLENRRITSSRSENSPQDISNEKREPFLRRPN